MTCLLQCLAMSSLLALQPGASDVESQLKELRNALKLREQGRSHDAGIALELLLRRPDLPPAINARVHNALGLIRRDQGRWNEAVNLFETAWNTVPPDTTDCALRPAISGNLGEVLLQRGKLRDARKLFQQALDMAQSCKGNEALAALQMLNLSGLSRMQGDYKLAHRLAEKATKELNLRLGPAHPHSILALNNLAQVYAAEGKSRKAIETMEHVKDLTFKIHGERHPLSSGVLSNLGVAYYEQQQYDHAESLLRQALAIDEGSYGPSHPAVARDLSNLAAILDRTRRTEEAETILRRVIDTGRKAGRIDARAMASLGTILLVRGKIDEATEWFSEVSGLVRTGAVPAEPDLAQRLEQFAAALRALHRPADAERYQAEATRLRTRALIDAEALRGLNYSQFWKGNPQ